MISFFLLNFNYTAFSKEIFNCNIYSELENEKPAKKRNYDKSQLQLFFDLKNKWLNDLPKQKWLEIEKDNLDRIEINFLTNKKIYKFFYNRYYSSKKKEIELSYKLIFHKKTGQMSFPKNYFNDKNEIFFSTEVRGFCKKNKI